MAFHPPEVDPLARAIAELLTARGQRLAVVETTAGGLISARLLAIPGASAFYERGIIAYSGRPKLEAVGVDRAVIETHGAVSREAVSAMAEAIRERARVEYAVAESGIAGPQASRRSPKPVGAVVLAVAGPANTTSEDHTFPGSRVEVMGHIAQRALELLHETLTHAGDAP